MPDDPRRPALLQSLANRQRLSIPIPGSAELGQQLTPEELCERVAKILCETPAALRAVVLIHAEVATWRLLSAPAVEPEGRG